MDTTWAAHGTVHLPFGNGGLWTFSAEWLSHVIMRRRGTAWGLGGDRRRGGHRSVPGLADRTMVLRIKTGTMYTPYPY